MKRYYVLTVLLFWGIQSIYGQVPTLNCPSDISITAPSGNCGDIITYTIPTCATNCTGTTITQTDGSGLTSGDFFPVGTTTIEYTISSTGGTSTCAFNITVMDVTPPNVVCPSDQEIYSDADCSKPLPDYSSLITFTEECDQSGVIINQSPAPGTSVKAGITVSVSLTATDTSGNETVCNFNVAIIDTVAPTFTCPGDQTVSSTNGCDAILGDYAGTIIPLDNCDDNPLVTQTPAAGTNFSSSQQVTVTVSDLFGNESSCTFLVRVDDSEAPIITCPANKTEYVDSNCDFVVPDYTGEVNITDNCDPNPTIQQIPSGGATINGKGDHFISFSVTDIAGNVSFCSFILTLEDTLGPNLTCPGDLNVYLDNNCEYSLVDYTSLVVASDNCGGATFLSQSPASGTLVNGTDSPVAITITAQDLLANTSGCTFNLILTDTIVPSIAACQNDTIVNADNNCVYVIGDFSNTINGIDNCSSSFTVTQSLTIGDTLLAGGPYPMTLYLADDEGNMDSCTFNIDVKDVTGPTLDCPLNPDVPADVTCAYTIPAYDTVLNINDNCSGFTYTQSVSAGTVINGIGTQQNIAIFVTDAQGNNNSCSFTITVADTTSPQLVCPPDQTVSINGACQYTLDDYSSSALISDFCDSSPTLTQQPIIGSTMTGINVVTLTVTDVSGNINTCSFNVIPDDITPPTITCPSNITSCSPKQSYLIPIGVDDCGSSTTTQSDATGLTSGSTFPVGSTTLEYTVTDLVGNTGTCSFDVTIYEPVVVDAGTSSLIDEGDSVTLNASMTNAADFTWSPDYRIDSVDALNPTVNPGITIYYVLSATSPDGCEAQDSVLIAVNTITELEINNFLSPNGDGSNDSWNVNKPALISGCLVGIYNRWGQIVWESSQYQNNWKGTNMNGDPLPEGTYYYIISCADEDLRKGSILLMR